jgi:hypothetical protein
MACAYAKFTGRLGVCIATLILREIHGAGHTGLGNTHGNRATALVADQLQGNVAGMIGG